MEGDPCYLPTPWVEEWKEKGFYTDVTVSASLSLTVSKTLLYRNWKRCCIVIIRRENAFLLVQSVNRKAHTYLYIVVQMFYTFLNSCSIVFCLQEKINQLYAGALKHIMYVYAYFRSLVDNT